MSGKDFNQAKLNKHYCISRSCNEEVYKCNYNLPYPLYCYSCQKKSDNETKATKPKDHKYTKYDKSL